MFYNVHLCTRYHVHAAPLAGRLWITWCVQQAPQLVLDEFVRHVYCRPAGVAAIADSEWHELERTSLVPFHGWVLQAAAQLKWGAKKQMWFLTFMAEFKGLSRSGRKLFARMGNFTTERFSDVRQERMLARQAERTR